jgi:hypothetical protein
VEVVFSPSEVTRNPFVSDNTHRLALIGPCEVEWHEGIRRTVEAHFPGAVKAAP